MSLVFYLWSRKPPRGTSTQRQRLVHWTPGDSDRDQNCLDELIRQRDLGILVNLDAPGRLATGSGLDVIHIPACMAGLLPEIITAPTMPGPGRRTQ